MDTKLEDLTRGRRLLVLGASGQIGGRLMSAATARFGAPSVAGTYNMKPAENLLAADLENPPATRELILELNPWAVIVAAAFAWVDGCEDEPERTWLINVEGPRAVATACREIGSVPVLLSTDYVFDGAAGPYAENAAVRPISAYGNSKLEAERAVSAACEHALIVRTNVVFSWHPGGKNFLMQVHEKLSAGAPMRVPRDQWNTPTHAPDLARGILELLERRCRGVYHYGGADYVDRYELALRMARVFGLDPAPLQPVTTAELGQLAARPLRGGLTSAKFEADVGRKTAALDDALAAALRESQSF